MNVIYLEGRYITDLVNLVSLESCKSGCSQLCSLRGNNNPQGSSSGNCPGTKTVCIGSLRHAISYTVSYTVIYPGDTKLSQAVKVSDNILNLQNELNAIYK